MRLAAVLSGLILISIGVPCSIQAQDRSSLVPLHVRVRLASNAETKRSDLVGSLVSLSNDTVVVLRDVDQIHVALPIASLRRFDMSEGQHSVAGKGALYGFLGGSIGGAGTALVLCAVAEGGCDTHGDHFLDGNWTAPLAVGMGLGLGLVGTGIGALVGSMIRTERWREVPIDRLRVGPNGSDGVSLSIRFTVH